MSKISPDGFVKTDIFTDFSIFNYNNIYIGEYAAKINKGSNNLIIGANAGKIGIGLNNSIFIGANAGNEFLDRDKVITIGDIQVTANKIDTESINIGYNIRNNSNGIVITNDKQHPQLFLNESSSLDIGIYNQGINETSIGNYNSNINSSVNIGYSNISTVNNSIVIGNSIRNNNFSLNIDDVLCADSKGIYIGCGIYKNVPIILGSSSLNTFTTSNNLDMGNNFITSVFKIKNDNNVSISFITDTNKNIVYNLPLAPKYEHSFLSVDINGNLEWIELSKANITDINSTAHIICNNLESLNLNGDGSLLTTINISNNTTDNLREGIYNLYLNIDLITKIFYSYIQTLTTDDIQNRNNYFNFNNYSNNFYSNLNLLTTDDIGGNRFYSLNDYYSNTSNYLFHLHTDVIKEGTSNFYYNPSNLTTDFIQVGISNLYFNGNLNISNTDIIKEGQSNLYYHQSIIQNNLSNTTTDFLKQGFSNLYATDNNLYEYVKSNLSTTDYIIQGTSNDYFCNISNQNKYPLITDNIREGTNLYYKSSNQITGIISFNTNTDFYKEGTSNLYFYENRAVDDYLKVITSNVTTDNFSNGINKKFITNNFYNNNLQINGFLKANNINDLDKENLRLNLEPKIGPLTEVYQVYDFERLSVIGRLSNIEIGYTADNNNDIKVPFIVIDNKVGINNSNPRYQLDVNGIINCSNLLIDNQYYYCNIVTITSNQILERIYSNTSYISSNNSNQLFNRFAFATGSADFTNYYTNDILSNIFITSNVLFDNLNKTWVVNDTSNIYNNNSSNVGIGISTPTYKLHVVGNVGVSGNVSQGFSDIRLKNKEGSIKNPFLIINNLESFYYTPNDVAKSFGFTDNSRTIGLNALEVQKYIPEAVSIAPFDMDENKQSKSGENYLTISYEKLIPVLLEGLKELKKEVEELKMKS